MTTHKCKLKISRLERETYLTRIENHIFALKSSTNTKSFSVDTINRVGLASGNKQLFDALSDLGSRSKACGIMYTYLTSCSTTLHAIVASHR